MNEYDFLTAENEKLRRVLARLTEREPRVRDRDLQVWRCGVCGGYLDWEHGVHAPGCAWAEARELLAKRPLPANLSGAHR